MGGGGWMNVFVVSIVGIVVYKTLRVMWSIFGKIPNVKGESTLFHVQHLCKKTSMLWMQKSHLDKYGPLYSKWLGKHIVCLADPVAVKFFFQRTDLFQKALQELAPRTPLVSEWIGVRNLVYVEGEEWKRQRKLITPAFHFDLLKKIAPLFRDVVDDFFRYHFSESDSDDGKGPRVIDVKDATKRFTLDVLGIASFGTEFKCLSAKPEPIAALYETIRGKMGRPIPMIVNVLSGFGLWDRLPLHSNKVFKDEIDCFRGILRNIVAKRRTEHREKERDTKKDIAAAQDQETKELKTKKKNNKKTDLVQLMFEAFELAETGETLSDLDFIDNLSLFVMAGHDTTASSLCMTLHNLAHMPDVQDKARAEVLAAIAKHPLDDDADAAKKEKCAISYEAQKCMGYLTNVIKETLRMYPPALEIPQRTAQQTCSIPFKDGSKLKVKKGTGVLVSVYSLHHNPAVFENPWKFRPDRFDNPIPPFAWVPFGGGPRTCLGINFSLIEQRILLADILRRYTLTPQDKMSVSIDSFGPSILLTPDIINVTFKPRI